VVDIHRDDVVAARTGKSEKGKRVGTAAARDHNPGVTRQVVESDKPREQSFAKCFVHDDFKS
jgi:hypothetical protein